MNGVQQFIGLVQDGAFHMLSPFHARAGSVRLTGIQMQASVPPETAELDLTKYEGKAIMVQGHDGGGWLYSATVIDEAGLLLTALVQQVFAQTVTHPGGP